MKLTIKLFQLGVLVSISQTGCEIVAPIENAGIGQVTSGLDSDSDGVDDAHDKCPAVGWDIITSYPSTSVASSLRRAVDQDGCPLVVMPRVCHGDQEAPRMYLGPIPNLPGSHANAKVSLFVIQALGRKMLRLQTSASPDDVDVFDACPSLDLAYVMHVKIGNQVHLWTCEAIELGKQPLYRQFGLLPRHPPCIFDPQSIDVSDADFLAALNAGTLQVAITAVAVDGASNRSTLNFGANAIPAGSCGISYSRSDPVGPITVLTIGCTACVVPTVLVQGLPTVGLPVAPAHDPGDGVGRGDVVLTYSQQFKVSNAGCAITPSAYIRKASFAGRSLMPNPYRPIVCSTVDLGNLTYQANCSISAGTLIWIPGGGQKFDVSITLQAARDERVGAVVNSTSTPL